MRPDEELPLSRDLPIDEDVRRELAHHLAERERELIESGWDPVTARTEARRAFGDLAEVNAECRDITRRARRSIRRARTVDSWVQDCMLAVRLLRKSPGYALAAIGTLALGIGATAAIFSVVNSTLLRPLPYDHPEQLVDIAQTSERGWSDPPYANMLDWRSQSRSFDGMASYSTGLTTTLTPAGAVRARFVSVSEDFFHIFRLAPALGRLPLPEEHRAGALPVAVVSHAFWRSQLGGIRDLTSQRLRVDREYQVVGVLPEGFAFPRDAEIWVPLELNQRTSSRTAHNESVIARLRAGVAPAEADRELDDLTLRMAELYRPDFDAVGAAVEPLQSQLTGSTRRPLYLLLGASALLLLTACTNLASTMLARGMARQQEMAVRLAIGAGRLRLVRQLFTESLLLAALGCLAGLGVAHLLLSLLVQLAPASLQLHTIRLDGWVILFTATVGVSTTVLIGLFPALRTSDASPGMVMRQGGRAGRSRAERRIWGGLVIAEVALAVVLLCGSGLLIRSFGRVLQVDPGFRTDSLTTVSLSLPTAIYSDDARIEQFWTRILDMVRGQPQVLQAGLTTALPLSGSNPSGSFGIEGVPPGPAGYGPGNAGYRMVSAEYFATLGVPLLRGRDFDARDAAGAPGTVIVNQALVDSWFRDQDPIGRQIRLQSGMDNQGDGWLTIIGVVGNVRHRSLTLAPMPELFVPLHQRPTRGYGGTIVIRGRGDLRGLERTLAEALQTAAPDAVPTFASMEERLARSLTDRRFTMVILSAFALISLLLAGVGIYGVVAYTAAQRTREMGIRLALGAAPVQVRSMVQREALTQVSIGLLAGSIGALLVTRVMQSLLFETGAADPAAFLMAAGLLFAAAWLASYLPAWRAARLDPMLTIRSE